MVLIMGTGFVITLLILVGLIGIVLLSIGI